MRLLVVVLAVAAVAGSTAFGSPHGIPPRSVVACDLRVGTASQPYGEAEIVLDRIGLPRGRYPWQVRRTHDPVFAFFAKWGALLRSGTDEPVTISVARPWRRHAAIGWGNARASSVMFLPCEAAAPWLAYAGGFHLKKRGCVPFDVEVGERIARVRIGFGDACRALADNPWRELRRPLHVPSVRAGERCPVTPARELSPAFGRGSGNGPVYPLVDRSLPFLYPVRRSQRSWYPSKWSGQKVLWVAPASFQGRVLVRGRRLDGRYLLRFGDGRRPVGELRMTFGPERVGEGGWLEYGSYTRVRAAGCYAWQIDGEGFSEVVVFRAVRVR